MRLERLATMAPVADGDDDHINFYFCLDIGVVITMPGTALSQLATPGVGQLLQQQMSAATIHI